MKYDDLKAQWKSEEAFAFKGWDFSHISGRWENEKLPWDYETILKSHLKSTDRLLDMGTGGGEFLLTLGHPHQLSSVTESYPPNVALCQDTLSPLGITVAQTFDDKKLPFEDGSFDIVINRHESFDPAEVSRVLVPGGYFITQQVGGANDRDLSERLISDFTPQFPEHNLENNANSLKALGFELLRAEEIFTPLRFFDVGALVYFAKIIEWEFPDFSVDSSFGALCECQRELERDGFVEGTEHRFIVAARCREGH